MKIIYAGEPFPNEVEQSIFLAGPTGISEGISSWRIDAIRILEKIGYPGYVFLPEPRDGKTWPDYYVQVEWENEGLNRADCILFWVPRVIEGKNKLPGFTTNIEFGEWFKSGKIVFGAPGSAEKIRYLEHKASQWQVPKAFNLEETVRLAVELVTPGAKRIGGECRIPLYIWRTESFQSWYKRLILVGNRLDGAKVEWTWRVGPDKDKVFIWVLHVDVYIEVEDRHKTNEVVIGRPDIAVAVIFRRGENVQDTEVVLIREFRSPVANAMGYVYEAPGGSSFKPVEDYRLLAVKEVVEETGVEVDVNRLERVAARQFVSTLSAHRAHVFSLELTAEEMGAIRERCGDIHGVVEDTEYTIPEVKTVKEIMASEYVDWSMVGMILAAIK